MARLLEIWSILLTTVAVPCFCQTEVTESGLATNGTVITSERISIDVLTRIKHPEKIPFNQTTQKTLSLMYNDSMVIINFPEYQLYDVWFRPLTEDVTVEIQFDFARIHDPEGYTFSTFSQYIYVLRSSKWHRLHFRHLGIGDGYGDGDVSLAIPEIGVETTVPHFFIAIKVSCNSGLVMWSKLKPEGSWIDDIAWCHKPNDESASTKIIIIVLSVIVVIVSVLLVVCIVFAVFFRQSYLKTKKLLDQNIYEEWTPTARNGFIPLESSSNST